MKRSGAVIVAVMLAGCQNVPAPTFDPFQARNTVPPPSLRPSAAAAPVDPYYSGNPSAGLPGTGGALPSTAPGAYAPTYTPGVTPPPQYVPPAVNNSGAAAPPATGSTNPYATQPKVAQPPATYAQPAQPAPTYGQPALPNVARPVSTPQLSPYGQPTRGTTPYSTPYSAPGVNTNNGYPSAAPVTIPPDNGGDGASERRPTGALPLRGVSIPRESIDAGESGRFGVKGTAGTGRSLALRRTKTPLSPDELAALEESSEEPVATQVAKIPVERTRRAFDTLPAVARRAQRPSASDEGPQLIAASDALPEISPWTPTQPTVRAMPVPRKPVARTTLAAGTVAAKPDLAATVPAPEVVRADLLTSDSEFDNEAQAVTHAFQFEPVDEDEGVAPRELPKTKSEPETPILFARWTIEPQVLETPTAKPTVAQPLSGYADDYAWLRGQLDFSAIDRRWKVRYIPIDGATDRFGGSVQLVDHAELSNFKSGDWVEVRGRLGRTTAADRGYAPPYEVRKIERQ